MTSPILMTFLLVPKMKDELKNLLDKRRKLKDKHFSVGLTEQEKHELIKVREQIDIIENVDIEYFNTAQNYIDEQTQNLKQVRQVLNELKENKNEH